LAAANDKGCRFGHHCCQRASANPIKHRGTHKLIEFYIILLNLLNRFDCGIGTSMRKDAHPSGKWVHQIHAAGGASSSTTMVMVFVR